MVTTPTATRSPRSLLGWMFESGPGKADRLIPRWLLLRALAAIYFSAFYSLLFQIRGLIGPDGVLPAGHYLDAVQQALGPARFWFAPTLLWMSASSHMLLFLCWLGLAASAAAFLNLWPRLSFFVCFVCFLSFVAAAGDFSGYQSDGMLLEAGFLALFFSPAGVRPGWGAATPPSRASLFLLQWEWFRIYFESGMVKLLSGDVQWRNFTAMDNYYQNGPLPTWVGWYVQQLPHWFHAGTVALTLGMELVVVLLLFFPRRLRLICFLIVTPWELGVILTANYTFLNYLVLVLGFLLLDDGYLRRFVPGFLRGPQSVGKELVSSSQYIPQGLKPRFFRGLYVRAKARTLQSTTVLQHPPQPVAMEEPVEGSLPAEPAVPSVLGRKPVRARGLRQQWEALRLALCVVLLTWIAYATTAEMILMPLRQLPLPAAPIHALEPFRIANQYGLFAVMTRGRYEIEFQGSNDGVQWTAYPFRYKPQALNERPGIYAPYQPRFDWNLWFASLGDWQQNKIVPLTEERLLTNDADVLALFRGNPFKAMPPKFVRAVLWQYWFTSIREKRQTGNWWRRELLGLYAPVLTRGADGKLGVVEMPGALPTHD